MRCRSADSSILRRTPLLARDLTSQKVAPTRRVYRGAVVGSFVQVVRFIGRSVRRKIVFSSLPKEVGNSVEPAIASSLPTLAPQRSPTPAPTEDDVIEPPSASGDGVQMRLTEGQIDSLRPIRNDAGCHKCHDAKQAQ